jgi:hypothetical protein
VKLLDLPRLRSQLLSLERRTVRGSGRDVVDHPTAGADDLINAVAGALVMAAGAESRKIHWSAVTSDGASYNTQTNTLVSQHDFKMETRRRAVVRTGNLDWKGEPIDANPVGEPGCPLPRV